MDGDRVTVRVEHDDLQELGVSTRAYDEQPVTLGDRSKFVAHSVANVSSATPCLRALSATSTATIYLVTGPASS